MSGPYLNLFIYFQTDSEYGRDSSNLKKYETEVENITKQLSNMNYEDGSFEEMEENFRNVKHETNSIKTQVDTMGARYPWLDFRYSGNKIIEIEIFKFSRQNFFPKFLGMIHRSPKHLRRFFGKFYEAFFKIRDFDTKLRLAILPTLLKYFKIVNQVIICVQICKDLKNPPIISK